MFDCPGDGTCSNQGTCDGKTGTCVCFEGFERLSGVCLGNNRFKAIEIIRYDFNCIPC